MKMYVYASKKKNSMHELTPIVVESNIEFALPYWTKRKQANPAIFWRIV
jgi:hypothetical protein